MTVKSRKNVIIFGLSVSIGLFFLSVWGLYLIYTSKNEFEKLVQLLPNFNPFQIQGAKGTIILYLLGLQLIVLIAVLIALYLTRIYKKTESPEIFFLIFFVISQSFESLRILDSLTFLSNSPYYTGMIITRSIYFGRIFSLITLLLVSLYLTGFNYKHTSTLLLTSLFIGLSLAIIIPVDTTSFTPNLIFKIGIENNRTFFSISLYLLISLNFLIAYLKNKNRKHMSILFFYMLILGGSILYGQSKNILDIYMSILLCSIPALPMGKAIEKIYLPI